MQPPRSDVLRLYGSLRLPNCKIARRPKVWPISNAAADACVRMAAGRSATRLQQAASCVAKCRLDNAAA